MTDAIKYADLLGRSEPEPTPVKKPRGRPRKTPVAVAPAAPPVTPKPTTLAEITETGEAGPTDAALAAAAPPVTPPAGVASLVSSLLVSDGTGSEAEHIPDTPVTPELPPMTVAEASQALANAKEASAVAAALAQLDAETAARKAAEAALPPGTAYELPPVSTAYAAAQAHRITIIGQPKREYAYQRVMRAGKRL